MNKKDVRQRIKALKQSIGSLEKEAAAQRVFAQLELHEDFQRADKILLYNSLPDELPTRAFIDKWHERKHIFLPRVNGDDLEILPYDSRHTHIGAFNIEEPDGDIITSIDDIDLVIVPAVAYDAAGNRVGRGKGYYDRLLQCASVVKIGVAFDFQIIEEGVDADTHDVSVDVVITDSRCFTPNVRG